MIDKVIGDYKKMPLDDKRDVLLHQMEETLKVIENVCKKNNVEYDKLKSKEYIKNKDKLLEEDYYDLLFIYFTYIREDLGRLL